jgi:hypothetical protein
MRRYQQLSFSDTYLDPIEIDLIGACPYFENLCYLGLHGTGLGDAELRALAEATRLRSLTSLNLNYSREDMDYTIAGVRALAGAAFAPQLEHLDIVGRWLGDELVEVLALFPSLTHVDVRRNELSEAAVQRLRQRFGDNVEV